MESIPNLSNRQRVTAAVIAFAEFATGLCISIQGPFFPAEAESKGATPSQYGFVFGCYELTIFFTSPLLGKHLPVLVPKLMLSFGLFITGYCSVLFGVLDNLVNTRSFVCMSFIIRIIEALGNAAFLTAAFAIIAMEFPESVAATFASLEFFFGIGLIVGPTLGGYLYQVGGYILPFAVFGATRIAASLLTYRLLPSCYYEGVKQGNGLFRILRIPAVLLASYSVFAASVTIEFLSATLEPHLRQFGLTPVLTGFMFVMEGGVFALTAPIWGYLCDRIIIPRMATLMGGILVILGFLFIGPIPFLHLKTSLTLVVIGLVTMGCGIGALLVSGFTSALQETIFHGFPNNLSTYGLVSGLWTSIYALGAFVGPSIAGILFDHFGFGYSSYFIIATNGILVTWILSFCYCSNGLNKRYWNIANHQDYVLASYSTMLNNERLLNIDDENHNGNGW